MKKAQFGIVGCGGAALSVTEALAESSSAQLGKVYDLDLNLARDIGARYQVPFAENLDELLADPAIDVVYIAAPHDQLYPIARATLMANKHALVEKPMALTLPNIDELIELSANNGSKLGVFYELRHTTPYQQARDLIQSGALGKVVGVRIQTLIDKPLAYWQQGYTGRSSNLWRAQKVRAGGGVVLMNTSHQLDAIRYITGLEVVAVTAQIATLTAPVEVEDMASATLVFDNGAIGSLLASAHAPGAMPGCDEHFDIIGTDGQMKVPDPYGDGSLQIYLRLGRSDIPKERWYTLPTKPTSVFKEAIEAFVLAVQQNEPVPTSGHDARQALAIVLAIYQAAQENRTVTIE